MQPEYKLKLILKMTNIFLSNFALFYFPNAHSDGEGEKKQQRTSTRTIRQFITSQLEKKH